MARTREDRLRLFDRHVTDLLTETGAHSTWTVSWNVEHGASTSGPSREALRSWLMAVRLLDDPKSDTDLSRIMADIEAMAQAAITADRLAALHERREQANVSRMGVVTGPDGPMTPRQCFEDLAYTDHFHHDHRREMRRAAMPPFIWEMVRFVGWDYAGELADIATWVQAAGREDPGTGHLFGHDE
jgi:hypothetical protein